MEGGVGKDGIELLVVGKRSGVVLFDVEIAPSSSSEHSGRVIDAGKNGPSCCELFCKGPITATEVKDVFAGLCGKEGDYVGC
jgi:hypothetical protein